MESARSHHPLTSALTLIASQSSGPVDQVYVLVSGTDVLQLHPGEAVELDGVLDVLAPLPLQLDLDAGLLEDFTHGRVVGKLVALDVNLLLHRRLGCDSPRDLVRRVLTWR
jgi:hypothetical protein